MAGTMKPPMAAAVAEGEPDRAPKSTQLKMAATAMPPGSQPTRALAKLDSRREMPPELIRLPASIKKGMAIRVKLSTEANSR